MLDQNRLESLPPEEAIIENVLEEATLPSRDKAPFLSSLLLTALGAISGGCTTTPLVKNPRLPEPLTLEMADLFQIQSPILGEFHGNSTEYRYRIIKGTIDIDQRDLEFELYMPTKIDQPVPLITVLPILGGGEEIAKMFCRRLANRGIAAGLLDRPWRIFKEDETVPVFEEKLIRSVREQRAFIDYISTRPDINPDQIGCLGISMGGMIGTILTAVEPRIKCSVICLAGGDFSTIIANADEVRLEKWLKKRAETEGVTIEQVQKEIKELVLVDPALLAKYIDPKRVLFVSARFDQVMPKDNSMLLWQELGKPEHLKIPFGHYTSIIAIDYISARTARFAKKIFEEL